MSDFKAKMHQICFPLGLCLGLRWRSLQRSPISSPAVFEGSTFKWMERWRGEGRNKKGREGKGEESGDKVERGIWPTQKFWRGAPYARPLAGRWGKGKGGGTEREKRGRKQEKGKEGKLKQSRRLAKTGPACLRGTAPRYLHVQDVISLSL